MPTDPTESRRLLWKGSGVFVYFWGLTAFFPFIGFGAATLFDAASVLVFFIFIRDFRLNRNDSLLLAIIIFVNVINCSMSHDGLATFGNMLQWWLLIFIIEKMTQVVGDRRLTIIFWRGLQASAVLVSIIVSADLMSGDISRMGGRYIFVFQSPQPLAFLFLMVSLVNIISLVSSFRVSATFRDFLIFFVFAFSSGLSLWVVAASASRTGLLGLIIGCGLVLGFRIVRGGQVAKPSVWGVAVTLLTVLGIFYGGGYIKDSVINTEIAAKVSERVEGSFEGDAGLVQGRIDLMHYAYDNFTALDLIFGTGLDAYTAKYSETKKPHNGFVLLLVEGGVGFWMIGMFFLTRWLLIPVRQLVRRARQGDPFFVIAPLALMAAMFVVMSFNTALIQRHLWVGVMLGAMLLRERMPSPKPLLTTLRPDAA